MSLQADSVHLLRDLAPRVLGAIVRRHGDFAAAEDAVQEALWAAASQWPVEGVPANPTAWLIQVASRRMTDHLRIEVARRRRENLNVEQDQQQQPFVLTSEEAQVEWDDSLLLLFMCCHPALTSPSAIALTLRAVGGLSTLEIAHAFLVPEATMAQRISRAKQLIKKSGVAFELPNETERSERLGSVLHMLYLIFNEGYASSSGQQLQRVDLSSEAIRLTRMLDHLLPHDPEVMGLLALMLLTDARRASRSGPNGELIPLDEQDRGLWDRTAIGEGVERVTRALSVGAVGAYQLQAAIAALHDEALSADDTDWPQIFALYGLLEQMSDNPMIRLNRAVAAAMVYGPLRGLQLLDALDGDPRIVGHHRLHAVRAHLHERAGELDSAIVHYRHAAEGTASTPERTYLLLKAARLAELHANEAG
jgi:RNA polymerase sigma factor (sigma-70 family)